jgi:NADH-quinone oxidoreductase subunit M
MVNHGLSTGLLFFCIGMLYERTHTRDMSEMGGIADVTPWIAATFVVATLSSIGLPGLNNFVGEFLVILGTFRVERILGAVAVLGVILSAIYMLWAYQRTFQGKVPERFRALPDMLPREFAAVIPVVAVMLFIGVYPKVVLDRVNPTTAGVVRWVRSVQVDQPGLPGGLRARVQPAYAGTQTVTIEPAAASGATP